MSDLKIQQAACVEVIRKAAETTIGKENLPEEDALPVAIDLFATAFAMKSAYQTAGLSVARRYCRVVGLDDTQVERFVVTLIRAEIEGDE
jgi:hypothetical protein